jgi:hypothetical protein
MKSCFRSQTSPWDGMYPEEVLKELLQKLEHPLIVIRGYLSAILAEQERVSENELRLGIEGIWREAVYINELNNTALQYYKQIPLYLEDSDISEGELLGTFLADIVSDLTGATGYSTLLLRRLQSRDETIELFYQLGNYMARIGDKVHGAMQAIRQLG